MKFKITNFYTDDSPHPKAFKEKYYYIDERSVDSPAKIPWSIRHNDISWWYNDGFNHRVENEHIKREFEYERWCINIENLEELMSLGNIRLEKSNDSDDLYEIILE